MAVDTGRSDFCKRISAIKTPLAMISPAIALKGIEDEEDFEMLDEREYEQNSPKNPRNSPGPGLPSSETPTKVYSEGHSNFVSTNLSMGKMLSPVSEDTISVLASMNGFLILPNNTDKVAHYFEAPSEEIRDL